MFPCNQTKKKAAHLQVENDTAAAMAPTGTGKKNAYRKQETVKRSEQNSERKISFKNNEIELIREEWWTKRK